MSRLAASAASASMGRARGSGRGAGASGMLASGFHRKGHGRAGGESRVSVAGRGGPCLRAGRWSLPVRTVVPAGPSRWQSGGARCAAGLMYWSSTKSGRPRTGMTLPSTRSSPSKWPKSWRNLLAMTPAFRYSRCRPSPLKRSSTWPSSDHTRHSFRMSCSSNSKRVRFTLMSLPSTQKQFSGKLVSLTPQDRLSPRRCSPLRPKKQAQFQKVSGA